MSKSVEKRLKIQKKKDVLELIEEEINNFDGYPGGWIEVRDEIKRLREIEKAYNFWRESELIRG